jgi:sigma-B regulation protein RsbU (phosphoserine phosphatase)
MTKAKHGNRAHQPAESQPSPPPEHLANLWPESQGPQGLRLISRHPLFAGVPPAALEPLIRHCEIRPLSTGQVLLSPGQANRTLYLLLEGQLGVRIDRVDSETGFVVGPGECAGEISVVDCGPATAYVVAEMSSQVLAIPESEVWNGLFQVPVIARNFLRLFANRFRARSEAMQRALIQQLRYEHMQKELAIAQEIQLGMLPGDLDFGPEIDIVAEMKPAQEVGGDFYDAFPVGPDEYCVAIGDVSGKGVPAALFMVRTMTLLRTELLKDQPIEEALGRLNVLLCQDNPTCMFATLIVGVLNKLTGVFHYVNAGHERIVFAEQGRSYRPLAPPRGIFVGIDPGARYEAASLTLEKGDLLLLYTDGVTEAMNPGRELYTLERLVECAGQGPATCAETLADRITESVQDFAAGAPPSDDVTLVVLRFLGSSTPHCRV